MKYLSGFLRILGFCVLMLAVNLLTVYITLGIMHGGNWKLINYGFSKTFENIVEYLQS